jgi:hypothetical protein
MPAPVPSQTIANPENSLMIIKAAFESIGNAPSTLKTEAGLRFLLKKDKEKNLQILLAPFLRQAAIRHLESGETPYVLDYRSTYNTLFNQGQVDMSLAAFLKRQVVDRAWGTYLEAKALADLLQMTLAITIVNDGIPQKVQFVNVAENPDAPVIHLYNSNSNHWYFYPEQRGATIGDGNCLYNAIAQSLRQIVLMEDIGKVDLKARPKSNPKPKTAISAAQLKQYAEQEKLWAKIKKTQPMSMDDLIKTIEPIIDAGDNEDHKLALKLAGVRVSTNPFDDAAPVKVLEKKKTPAPASAPKKMPIKQVVKPEPASDPAPSPTPKTAPKTKTKATSALNTPLLSTNDAAYQQIEKALKILRLKTKELTLKGKKQANYLKAGIAATELLNSLEGLTEDYFLTKKIQPNRFILQAIKAMDKAKPVLEKHRGWKQIMGNIGLAIVGVGVGYLVAGLLNKAITGNFLFFKTDSALKLEKIKKDFREVFVTTKKLKR